MVILKVYKVAEHLCTEASKRFSGEMAPVFSFYMDVGELGRQQVANDVSCAAEMVVAPPLPDLMPGSTTAMAVDMKKNDTLQVLPEIDVLFGNLEGTRQTAPTSAPLQKTPAAAVVEAIKATKPMLVILEAKSSRAKSTKPTSEHDFDMLMSSLKRLGYLVHSSERSPTRYGTRMHGSKQMLCAVRAPSCTGRKFQEDFPRAVNMTLTSVQIEQLPLSSFLEPDPLKSGSLQIPDDTFGADWEKQHAVVYAENGLTWPPVVSIEKALEKWGVGAHAKEMYNRLSPRQQQNLLLILKLHEPSQNPADEQICDLSAAVHALAALEELPRNQITSIGTSSVPWLMQQGRPLTGLEVYALTTGLPGATEDTAWRCYGASASGYMAAAFMLVGMSFLYP